MKNSTIVIALAFIGLAGAAHAADEQKPAEQQQRNPAVQITGFGSGSGMGPGAGFGSSNSFAGGNSFGAGNSGGGSQSFGGGFSQNQAGGSGPLSTGSNGSAPIANQSGNR
jgi:hypothetical protein